VTSLRAVLSHIAAQLVSMWKHNLEAVVGYVSASAGIMELYNETESKALCILL
jgi:hypothetical protein